MSNYKLGIAFNVFSGLEFLEPAIRNCRDQCDKIIVVYQTLSNTGIPAPDYLHDLLKELEPLVDVFYHYETPNRTVSPGTVIENNRIKRERGRQIAEQEGCTHYQCRDCDEFYIPEQFEEVKTLSQNYAVTYGGIYEYLWSPCKRRPDLAGFYVPFIHRIDQVYTKSPWPFKVDPARRVALRGHFLRVPTAICTMHHMTRVRINRKSYKCKFGSHSIYNQKAKIAKLMTEDSDDVVIEPDRFGITEYWQNNFSKYEEMS